MAGEDSFTKKDFLGGANAMLGFVSLFAAQQEARAARAQGDFEKEQFLINARFSELQAQDSLRRGAKAASRLRSEARRLRGSQRAAAAASGVDVSSGSVRALEADTQLFGEFDAITAENNAFREAFGFRAEAAASRTSGEFSKQNSRLAAGNTLITGGLRGLQFSAEAAKSIDKSKVKSKVNNKSGFNGSAPVAIKRKRIPGVL